MAKDVNELVLDAFRIEHREQLERIRTLLESLDAGKNLANDARVQEAFRLAHSLKGGARVCDLRHVEQLGHGLESLLERLSHGDLQFSEGVVATITGLLDCVEDCMAALDCEKQAPDISDNLAAIDRVLKNAAPQSAQDVTLTNSDRLRQVFIKEHAQHASQLQGFLSTWKSKDHNPNDDEIKEAARLAHTIAGAAAIVEFHDAEIFARKLEQLLRAACRDRQRLDSLALRQIEDLLRSLAEAVRSASSPEMPSANDENHVKGVALIAELATDPEIIDQPEVDLKTSQPAMPAATATIETVRVSVETLDRLMRSASEMVADNQHVSHLARQLAALQIEVNDLERERETIRRVAAPSLHSLAAMPEFGRISRYVEYIDRKVNNLAKRARQVTAIHRQVTWLLRARSSQVQREVHEARLVPAHSVFQGFRKMVRDLAESQGKEITFAADGLDVRADRLVLQELKDSIMHLLRNCVSHGIESPEERREKNKAANGQISIRLEASNGRLVAAIEDDGRGIDLQQVKRRAIERGMLSRAIADHQSTEQTLSLLFEPGFSTVDSVTELAGRGIGLSVVRDTVGRLQGQVTISPREFFGVRVTLSVPIYVSTHRLLLVACAGDTFALPTRSIERLLRVSREKVETVEGQPVILYGRQPVRLMSLSDVLGQPPGTTEGCDTATLSVVLVKLATGLLAISVDALLEERDALILNLDEFAESDRFAGGILLEDGQAALVLRTSELMKSARHNGEWRATDSPAAVRSESQRVLIVDDSFTTRTLEKSILESQGYEVSVAVDGLEAISQLQQQKYDLVISDVEMPRMDGFALLEQIKSNKRVAKVPVILVTSRDRREDQQRGLDLGAEAYIVKRKFDHQELLNTIRQLL